MLWVYSRFCEAYLIYLGILNLHAIWLFLLYIMTPSSLYIQSCPPRSVAPPSRVISVRPGMSRPTRAALSLVRSEWEPKGHVQSHTNSELGYNILWYLRGYNRYICQYILYDMVHVRNQWWAVEIFLPWWLGPVIIRVLEWVFPIGLLIVFTVSILASELGAK